METKNISTSQKDFVKAMAEDFEVEDVKVSVVYVGEMSSSDYCHFIGIDYATAQLLGEVSYKMTYFETEDKTYQLACETYINNIVNDKLSFILEDSEDYLGFFTQKEEQKIDVAQRLPSNWKELITDEQKEEIACEWCKNNSCKLIDYLDVDDKERIANEYIDDNVIDKVYDKLGDYERREFIKNCIDNL